MNENEEKNTNGAFAKRLEEVAKELSTYTQGVDAQGGFILLGMQKEGKGGRVISVLCGREIYLVEALRRFLDDEASRLVVSALASSAIRKEITAKHK